MSEIMFKAGEVIFREGEPSKFAYLIKSGKVDLVKDYPQNSIVIARLEPNEILGEMSLVEDKPRSLTALAVGEVCALVVTYDEFMDTLLHRPEESVKYIRVLFGRIRVMNSRIRDSRCPSVGGTAATVATKVALFPLTKECQEAIPLSGLEVRKFPFRVGRLSSKGARDDLNMNHLNLPDILPYNVSRSHFSIETIGQQVVVRDNGSSLGTIVNGKVVGGHRAAGTGKLVEGENEIIVGSTHSPFRFRVVVELPK